MHPCEPHIWASARIRLLGGKPSTLPRKRLRNYGRAVYLVEEKSLEPRVIPPVKVLTHRTSARRVPWQRIRGNAASSPSPLPLRQKFRGHRSRHYPRELKISPLPRKLRTLGCRKKRLDSAFSHQLFGINSNNDSNFSPHTKLSYIHI